MTGEVDLRKLIELMIQGGWPRSLGLTSEQASLLPAQYLEAVIDDDVYRMDGVKRDTQKMRLLGDLETLGFLFEALCERDLRFYAESFGAQLYHYQDIRARRSTP